jgi:hypothetical protein
MGRGREMRSQLEDMCFFYAGLKTIDTWPDELQHEPLINRALDVRSSFMQYLAVQIEHANTRLGKAGKFQESSSLLTSRASYESVFHRVRPYH